MDRIGAAVWATGRAGRVIVEAGLTRPWLEFRGGIVYSPAKEGLDLGEACGLDVRARRPGHDRRGRRPGAPRHRRRLLCGPRHPGRGRRGVSPGEPCREGRHHDRRARPSAHDPRAAAAAELDASARAAGGRILGTGLWDFLTISAPAGGPISNVLTFDEIRLERIADMTLWGHGILRDEGIGGPPEAAGAGFMMRNFLVEALMLLGESCGLELDEPVFESVPVMSDRRREAAGYVVEAGTICGHDRKVSANVRGGGRLVSVWRGRFQPEHDGMEGSASVVVEGEPGVRDDRPRRPLPRHVSAHRCPGDGRRPPTARTGARLAHDRRTRAAARLPLGGSDQLSRATTVRPRAARASTKARGSKAASGGWTPARPPRETRSAAIAATVPVIVDDADRPVSSTAKS